MKLAMEKAFDKNWGFLIKVLRKFGFYNEWINLVSACLSHACFSVLFLGEGDISVLVEG